MPANLPPLRLRNKIEKQNTYNSKQKNGVPVRHSAFYEYFPSSKQIRKKLNLY